MKSLPEKGISRQGLPSSFDAEEARKSDLLLRAALLREQGMAEEAASCFAQAAAIEEKLAELCEQQGLNEKSQLHRFSAASSWAQAGNFYQAITLCQALLSRHDLAQRLRQRVQQYAETLSNRRNQWYAELIAETTQSV